MMTWIIKIKIIVIIIHVFAFSARARALTLFAFFFLSSYWSCRLESMWVCLFWLVVVGRFALCMCVVLLEFREYLLLCGVYICIIVFRIFHGNILRSVLSSSWQILKSPQSWIWCSISIFFALSSRKAGHKKLKCVSCVVERIDNSGLWMWRCWFHQKYCSVR